jgi:hypothetical protein
LSLAGLLSRLSEILDVEPRIFEPEGTRAAAADITRVEVAEASFEYCAAFFAAHAEKRPPGPELQLAYKRLVNALSPISDEDLHELFDRLLPPDAV